jgi:hypothetical protein
MDTTQDTRELTEEQCFYCLDSGYHFIGSIDEDGDEVVETYRCRRCRPTLETER